MWGSFAAAVLAAMAKAGMQALAESIGAAITEWYIGYQKGESITKIGDAIALLASAASDEDRFKAMDALQLALSRPRVTK